MSVTPATPQQEPTEYEAPDEFSAETPVLPVVRFTAGPVRLLAYYSSDDADRAAQAAPAEDEFYDVRGVLLSRADPAGGSTRLAADAEPDPERLRERLLEELGVQAAEVTAEAPDACLSPEARAAIEWIEAAPNAGLLIALLVPVPVRYTYNVEFNVQSFHCKLGCTVWQRTVPGNSCCPWG